MAPGPLGALVLYTIHRRHAKGTTFPTGQKVFLSAPHYNHKKPGLRFDPVPKAGILRYLSAVIVSRNDTIECNIQLPQ